MSPNVNAKASRPVQKLDLDRSIGDVLLLSDQLIQPLFDSLADALLVNVDA
jgi:hypothetical protein